MKKGTLINDLELGYAPTSAYAFRKLIRDKDFHQNVYDSHLYIIGQRPEITFNNFSFSSKGIIKFEISQEANSEILKCELPIFQEHIATEVDKSIAIRLQNRKNTIVKKNKSPYNGTQGIIFQEINEKTNETNHLIWFSPEKLLQNYWKGHIKLDFTGDFKTFLDYKVHYVGKSTEQNICKRLSNHSTFQEILINEESLTYGNIPSNEIVIILLRIKDNNTIMSFGDESSAEEMAYYIQNHQLPDDKSVSLDAEKALIKHLQPEYNRIMYNSYPNKNDLMNTENLDVILYGIVDPVRLIYQNGQISGGELLNERDYIIVKQKK